EDADGLAGVCEARCEAMTLLDGHIALTDAPETLDALSCVSEVGGNVELRGSGVRSLSGLAHITRIGGDLVVASEPELTGFTGLEALTEVGGDLRIVGNPRLSDEAGEALADGVAVTGTVEVVDNGLAANFDNPAFDETTARSPAGWTLSSGSASRVQVALNGDSIPNGGGSFSARSGSGALRMTGDDDIENDRTDTLSQERTKGFAAGERFELSGWVRMPSSSTLQEPCRAYLWLELRDGSSVIASDRSSFVDEDTPTDTWRRLIATADVSAETVAVRAGAALEFNECGGTVYIDDLRLRKAGL
ncbi:MAG: hypothetical protein AAF211_29245, partial [Myxococcota bacterium]